MKQRAFGSTVVNYWFREADLAAYVKQPKVVLPPDRLTVSQAAAKLRLSRNAVLNLCREGILDASWGEVAAGWTRKAGWLIAAASVDRAWEVMRQDRNRIRRGWALRKAKKEVAKGPEKSFNSSFNSKKKMKRGSYKPKEVAEVISRVKWYLKQRKKIKEAIEETAFDLTKKVEKVKSIWYRHGA